MIPNIINKGTLREIHLHTASFKTVSYEKKKNEKTMHILSKNMPAKARKQTEYRYNNNAPKTITFVPLKQQIGFTCF